MSTKYIASNWRLPNQAGVDSYLNDNYGLTFDGSEFINTDLSINIYSFSVSCWFKGDNLHTGTQKRLFDFADSTRTLNKFPILFTGSSAYATIGSGKIAVLDYSGSVGSISADWPTDKNGEWNHIVLLVNNTSVELYLNGSSLVSGTITRDTSYQDMTKFVIGAAANTIQYYYNGSISELAVFDYVLSESQISTLYGSSSLGSASPLALKPAPVAFYPLGDNSSGNPLTQPNEAVEDASVFNFDSSSNSFIQANNVNLDSANKFTVSLWLKVTSDSFEEFFSIYTGSSMNFFIGRRAGNRLDIYFGSFIYQSSVLNTNSFDNIIVVFDGTQASNTDKIKCFVNGNQISLSGSTSNTSLPSGSKIIYLGRRGSTYLDGELSNVAVWNTDQSSEISNIYNSGVPATSYTNTPTAWYKLDQSANWEADSSGDWQIPDAVSAYPQSFDFGEANTGSKYITTTYFPNGETNFTYSTWLNANFHQKGTPLAAYGGSTHQNLKVQFWTDTGGAVYVFVGGAYGFFANFSLHGYPGNEWTNISIVYDGTFTNADTATQNAGRLKLYINGNYEAFNSFNGTIPSTIPSGNTGFYLGTQTPTTFEYGGKMSNVMLFDSSLPATGTNSIQTLYNNGVPLTTAIATDNLKAWYKLDNTEVFNSPTIGSANWYVNNNANSTAYNSALKFVNSENDSVDVADSSSLKIQEQITICAWVNLDNFTDFTNIIDKQWDGADRSYVFRVYGRRPQFLLGNASGSAWTTANSSSTLDYNEWYFLAAVYDGSEMKIYINGTPDGTPVSKTDNISPNNSALSIGNASLYTHGWNGMLSNVMLFNTGLSQSDITTLYNNGNPVTDLSSFSSAVSWWKLNNLTTGIQDAIGSNNGTNSGATKVNTFVSTNIGISSGMTEQNLVNNNVSALNGESSGMTSANLVLTDLTRNLPYDSYSFNFDSASSDHIDCGTTLNSMLELGDSFSVSAWINFGNTASDRTIVSNMTTSVRGFQFRVLSNEGIRIILAENGSTFLFLDSSSLAINTWHHAVFTYDGSNTIGGLNLYINSSLDNNTTGTQGTLTTITSTDSLKIGAYTSAHFFEGNISNVSLFNKELTSTEVQKLYSNGMPQDLTTFTPAPIAFYPLGSNSFWNGSQWTVRDMSTGGSNDGTGQNIGIDGLVGNTPRSEANGTGTNNSIPENLVGTTKYSSNNSWSINMSNTARVQDTP